MRTDSSGQFPCKITTSTNTTLYEQQKKNNKLIHTVQVQHIDPIASNFYKQRIYYQLKSDKQLL